MNKLDTQNKIIIYKTKSGVPEIDVKIEKDTVWLTEKQIAQLFDVNVPAISKHINNIYNEEELNQGSTISKMETVQKEDNRQILRNIDHYNLDMIVSVGYRVNSRRATQFRIWATNTLKQYLLNGYAVNTKRLTEEQNKLKEIQRVVSFIEKQSDKYLLKDKTRELLSLVNEYTRSLTILHQYDEGKIKISKTQKPSFVLDYKISKNIIIEAKAVLKQNNEASDLFGSEINNNKFVAIGFYE